MGGGSVLYFTHTLSDYVKYWLHDTTQAKKDKKVEYNKEDIRLFRIEEDVEDLLLSDKQRQEKDQQNYKALLKEIEMNEHKISMRNFQEYVLNLENTDYSKFLFSHYQQIKDKIYFKDKERSLSEKVKQADEREQRKIYEMLQFEFSC